MPPPADQIAPVGRRVAAHLLDVVTLTALQLAVFFAVAEKGQALGDGPTGAYESQGFTAEADATAQITLGDDRWFLDGGPAALYIFAVLALWTLVYGVLQGRTGQTPGKKLLGLRIVGADGGPPGIGAALLRSIMWIVDAFPYFIPWLTGFITASKGPEHRRLGDRTAGTWVVRAGGTP